MQINKFTITFNITKSQRKSKTLNIFLFFLLFIIKNLATLYYQVVYVKYAPVVYHEIT